MKEISPVVTVFTPTYNRAYSLERLFRSLYGQTNRGFEWIVVDDGSTDDTKNLLARLALEASFPVKWFDQENGGKHVAINKGLAEASGELFFIVDSDDYLSTDAIETVCNEWARCSDEKALVGLCYRRFNIASSSPITPRLTDEYVDCSSIDAVYKYGLRGDKAEIFRTVSLRENPFPVFRHEKFVTEALVWNRVTKNKKMRYLNNVVYYCEYLSDGLSAKVRTLYKNNPRGMMQHYYEFIQYKIPARDRMKGFVWLMYYCAMYALSRIRYCFFCGRKTERRGKENV